MSDTAQIIAAGAAGMLIFLLLRIAEKLDRVIRLLEIGNDINNERRD